MKNVCSECGSDKVQAKYWVELNTQKVIDEISVGNDISDNWCPDCQDHVRIDFK